jgi:glycosyltransferase involved in cell wall biosynthesis
LKRSSINSFNSFKLKPLIFWHGLPPCGLLIKGLDDFFGDDLKIVATKANVPFGDLEALLGRRVDWLSDPDDIWVNREKYADRNFIIHTNWIFPGWLKYDLWMKKKGATVVVALDNIYKGTFKQLIGAIWFRVWLRRYFDAAFVPGKASTQFMQFLGMPLSKIFTGYYGAYEGIFYPGKCINERPKEFLFIGQLIPRKGLDLLVEAYKEYRLNGGTYLLRIVGSGALQKICTGDGIIYEGFISLPDKTADLMRNARFLIVPSREDHWATVVCEAMACGTPVIASSKVGAVLDLLIDSVNGLVLEKSSKNELVQALLTVEKWSEEKLLLAQQASIKEAEKFTSSAYAAGFTKMALALRGVDLDQSLASDR